MSPATSPNARAVGIDIGGTKMAVAVVDGAGAIRARVTLPTEAELGFARAVERLTGAIETVCTRAGWRPADLRGVGLGCAGPVDPARGLINNPYTLGGWDRCDIVTPLRARFGAPVRLENDADAAAVGECFAGAGRGFDPVVMLTLGTGVGGAAIVAPAANTPSWATCWSRATAPNATAGRAAAWNRWSRARPWRPPAWGTAMPMRGRFLPLPEGEKQRRGRSWTGCWPRRRRGPGPWPTPSCHDG